MTATRPQILLRALVGLVTLGVVLTPTLVPRCGRRQDQGSQDARPDGSQRVLSVAEPQRRSRTCGLSSRKHFGTDITGPCTAGVFASHPGVASVYTAPNLGTYVRVRANGGAGLTTTYGYLGRAFVKDGQIIQSGQAIGQVGKRRGTSSCRLYFSVDRSGGRYANPSTWLNAYVGKLPPVPRPCSAPAAS